MSGGAKQGSCTKVLVFKAAVAVLCAEVTAPTSSQGGIAEHGIVFWNLKEPYQPEQVLVCRHLLLAFDINPFNPDIVIGGCANGHVTLWSEAAETVVRPSADGTLIHPKLHRFIPCLKIAHIRPPRKIFQ